MVDDLWDSLIDLCRFWIFDGGWDGLYVIIPLPMLCTGENILPKQKKMVDFNDSSKLLTKLSSKMQNSGQSGP